MGVPAGPWHIDDLLTFTAVTHKVDTGVLTDADSVPTYRIYEDETGTAILNGSMAKLDDANTTGFYSEQLTLSAANGFENGKSYAIYISATVNSIVGGQTFNFKVDVPDVNVVTVAANAITAAAIADGAIDRATFAADTGHQSIRSGTAQAGAAGTITLDASASATDNFYSSTFILLTGGTGAGQVRRLGTYTGATKVGSVSPNWTTAPDSTSTFAILPVGYIKADVQYWNGTILATPDTAGYPVVTVKDGTGQGEILTTSGRADVNVDRWNGTSVPAPTVAGVPAVEVIDVSAAGAADVANAVLDQANGVETGWTLRQVLKLFGSVLLGKLSGAGTGTEVFRDITDTKDRVTATVDASGNRTVVTKDAT